MKRITKKRLFEFIDKVSDKKPSKIPGDGGTKCYYSKVDGSYLTRAGMEEKGFKYLLRLGITDQLQNTKSNSNHTTNIGFNPEEQKWYGWSHRAIYGFGVGSKVKKGDCAYCPTDKNDFLDDNVRFWSDDHHKNVKGKFVASGVQISWEYDNKIPNKKIRGTINSVLCDFPTEYGKGEWTAKTIEDAKQMAMDFAESVS